MHRIFTQLHKASDLAPYSDQIVAYKKVSSNNKGSIQFALISKDQEEPKISSYFFETLIWLPDSFIKDDENDPLIRLDQHIDFYSDFCPSKRIEQIYVAEPTVDELQNINKKGVIPFGVTPSMVLEFRASNKLKRIIERQLKTLSR